MKEGDFSLGFRCLVIWERELKKEDVVINKNNLFNKGERR